MSLILELFVSDLEKSRRFYEMLLGFTVDQSEKNGYTRLSLGMAHIALNDVRRLPRTHPSRQEPGEKVGKGFEIGISVEDIRGYFEQVLERGGQAAETLKDRPWGSTDFCIEDPDGNYLRFTSK